MHAKLNQDKVTMRDFEEAKDKVMMGSRVVLDRATIVTTNTTRSHTCGKFILTIQQTINPRGGSGRSRSS